jgi:6-pyruvoyltetrahydropterin/6-carboxytetrahydropterin synthase
MISLTRKYRFSASHRLHSPLLSNEENRAVFGKCNNPYSHGHNYVLSVTVAGQIDEGTGLLVNVRDLDKLVQHKVLDVFAYCNINADIPGFAQLVPTTENIALHIANSLQEHWCDFLAERNVYVHRIHVQETERNGFEVVLPVPRAGKERHREGLLINA